MQLFQDVVFTTHVVRRLYLAAKRRPAQNHLFVAERYGIGEVGMAAGKLTDSQRSGQIWQVAAQVWLEASQIKFFAGAYLARMILKLTRGRNRFGHLQIPR